MLQLWNLWLGTKIKTHLSTLTNTNVRFREARCRISSAWLLSSTLRRLWFDFELRSPPRGVEEPDAVVLTSNGR